MAKPTEIKKVAQLLEQEHDSAEAASKAVWELVEQLIADREQWVVVAVHPDLKIAQAVGPYNTENQLVKDYKKRIHAYNEKSYAFRARLEHQSKVVLD